MVVWGSEMKDYECGEDMKECPFCGSNDIIGQMVRKYGAINVRLRVHMPVIWG